MRHFFFFKNLSLLITCIFKYGGNKCSLCEFITVQKTAEWCICTQIMIKH